MAETKAAAGTEKIEDRIRAKLQEMRAMLQADGGDMEVIGIEGSNVRLKLKGACAGCPHAQATLKHGIEQALRQFRAPGQKTSIYVIGDEFTGVSE